MSKKTFCGVFFVMCVKKITNERGTPSKVNLKFEHSLGPIERFPYFIVNRRSFCGSWLTVGNTPNLRDMILKTTPVLCLRVWSVYILAPFCKPLKFQVSLNVPSNFDSVFRMAF